MPSSSNLPFPAPMPNWALPDPGCAQGTPRSRARSLNFARLDPLDLGPDFAATGPCTPPPCPEGSSLLADRLARFLLHPAALTFATGAAALRHTLGALLAPEDEVIVDAGASPAMFETVLQASARLHRCPPGSVEAVERRLLRLAKQRRQGRILVAVPTVARLSSVTADLAELCTLCATYGASLVVDVSQDLGAIGQAGQGLAEVQTCLASIDVIVGDLGGTFGAAGGFAAFRDPALVDRVRALSRRCAPLPPASAATILAALDLVDSTEGRRRRRLLHGNVLRLRNQLMSHGLQVMGHPSSVVPVRLPYESAEALTALLRSAGPDVPLVRAPEVARHAPRWHIRLGAGHGPADIDDLADLMRDVIRAGRRRAIGLRRPETLPLP